MKDFLTVNEYAAVHGMSHQAVYKSIKTGKLATEDRIIDGKRLKVVVVDPDQADEPKPSPAGHDAGPLPKAVPADNMDNGTFDKAIEALTRQLEEKDRQIAEKDRQISNLMQLLHDQQELQAHSQMLLSQGETEIKTDPEIVEAPPEEKPKRRGFWDWWFS